MSDETTQHMTDADRSSFEERVFARFDTLDAILRNLVTRFKKHESLAYDEKLAWEQFLKEAVEMRKEVTLMRREWIGAKPAE